MFELLLLLLATAYTTHVLMHEGGPMEVFTRIRNFMKPTGLMACAICFSFWSSLFIYVAYNTEIGHHFVYVLAIAGAYTICLMLWGLLEEIVLQFAVLITSIHEYLQNKYPDDSDA